MAIEQFKTCRDFFLSIKTSIIYRRIFLLLRRLFLLDDIPSLGYWRVADAILVLLVAVAVAVCGATLLFLW
jgi:hypothetical protein